MTYPRVIVQFFNDLNNLSDWQQIVVLIAIAYLLHLMFAPTINVKVNCPHCKDKKNESLPKIL